MVAFTRFPALDRGFGKKVEAVKAYVAVKVRLLGFDPPQSSTTMEALKNTASEMEWRLNVEHGNTWDGQ